MTDSIDRDEQVRQRFESIAISHQEDEKFEQSLGRFMIAWADAEAELYRVLVAYSQVSDPVARALFSGTRAKAMMDFIKSIAHNIGLDSERKADLEYVFPQLSAINTMRDHLVHHASSSFAYNDPKKRIVANTRASRYGNAKGFEIGADTITAMTWDLYAISNHLNMHWGKREGPFIQWRENPEDEQPTQWAYKVLNPIASWETSPKPTITNGSA